ncbi:MAG: YncE family protein [Fimbriimonadaceae bacterium]
MISLALALLANFHAPADALPLTEGIVVDVPGAPRFDYMAVDAKYGRVFASHTGAGALSVYDLKTKAETELQTGVVNGVQVNERLGRIFVGGGGKKLLALDERTLKTVGEVGLDGPGDDVVVDTKRNQVWVCHDDGTEDWVFDAKTLKLDASVKVDFAPEYVEYDPRTDRLYQNIKSTDKVQVIDPKTKQVVAEWPTPPMKSPHGLALDVKTGRVFAAGANGKMAVFEATTGKLLAMIDVKPGIDQIAFDPGLKRVYCAARGFISVVQETAAGAENIGDVPAPLGAHTIAVDKSNHTVWICYGADGAAHLKSFVVSSS